jgi:thiol:disulfide interchange protein
MKRSNTISCAVVAAVATFLVSGQAVAGEGASMLARWPLLVAAGLLFAASIGIGQFLTKWNDLAPGGRVGRVVGLMGGSLAAFLLLFGSTEAPPLSGDTASLQWHTSWEQAREQSVQSDRPLMIDFRADWCKACDELEQQVFHHPRVLPELRREFVLLKIDYEERSESTKRLLKRFEVVGLPRVAFVSPGDVFLREPSFEGKLGVDAFLERLEAARSGSVAAPEKRGIGRRLSDGGLLATLATVFLAGFLASLTPCVYPLIPITIGVFGARAAESRGRALALSLTYVLGIGITYTVLGLLAASFGTVFGGILQNTWVLVGLAAVFVLLGLASLGAIEFALPSQLQTRLSQTGGAGYGGALSMGLVAGLIAAPCVGPIVAGILVYVAQQGSLWLGGLLLFDFAMGLGVLFVVLGTFSGLVGSLPTSGAWMDGVKAVFAMIFFGIALYYLQFGFEPMTAFADGIWRAVAAVVSG